MEDNIESISNYSTPKRNCVSDEVVQLRKEVDDLRREIEYLRVIVLRDAKKVEPVKTSFKPPIEIKLPIFRDENRDSPSEFMRNFDQYCTIKEVPEEFVPILLESALKDRAGLWFQVVKDSIDNFDQFRAEFVEEFFSIEVKTRAKDSWRNKKYASSDGPMLSFIYKQISEICNIDPTMDEYERNYIILRQLPMDAQIGSSGIDLRDTKKLTYAIGRMDDARRIGNKGGQNEFFRGNEKNHWGTAKNNFYSAKQADNSGSHGQGGEFRPTDRSRETSWRERKDFNPPVTNITRNRPDSNQTQNGNYRNQWRDGDKARNNRDKPDNHKRVAAINVVKESSQARLAANEEDLEAITVQADFHRLND